MSLHFLFYYIGQNWVMQDSRDKISYQEISVEEEGHYCNLDQNWDRGQIAQEPCVLTKLIRVCANREERMRENARV